MLRLRRRRPPRRRPLRLTTTLSTTRPTTTTTTTLLPLWLLLLLLLLAFALLGQVPVLLPLHRRQSSPRQGSSSSSCVHVFAALPARRVSVYGTLVILLRRPCSRSCNQVILLHADELEAACICRKSFRNEFLNKNKSQACKEESLIIGASRRESQPLLPDCVPELPKPFNVHTALHEHTDCRPGLLLVCVFHHMGYRLRLTSNYLGSTRYAV